MGVERAAWEGQGWVIDCQRETLRGDEGDRAGNRRGGGEGRTDGELKSRECRGEAEIRRGKYWGELCASLNGEMCVWVQNTC